MKRSSKITKNPQKSPFIPLFQTVHVPHFLLNTGGALC
jgi:hypothetical protein